MQTLSQYRPTGIELSARERILAKAAKALGIIDYHRELQDTEYAQYKAFRASMDTITEDLAQAMAEWKANEDHPKTDAATKTRTEGRIAALKLKRIEKQKAWDARETQNRYSQIDAFISQLPFGVTYRDANTTDALRDGETPTSMYDVVYRNEHAQARDAIKGIEKAGLPREAIKDKVRSYVMDQATYVNAKELRKPGASMYLPNRNDAFAMLCAVLPDQVITALTKQALDGYDDRNALSASAKKDALADANARLVDIERKAEFWRRECIKQGVGTGKGLGYVSSMEAVLDVVRDR